MHDPRNVANRFIQLGVDAGKPFTPLQIGMLTYFAHAWTLGIHSRPLIDETAEYETWKYGPVLSDIYWCLSHHKGSPVIDKIPIHPDDDCEFSEEDDSIIQQVFDLYGHLSGVRLEELARARGTPWDRVRKRMFRNNLYIPNDIIRRYYGRRYQEYAQRSRR